MRAAPHAIILAAGEGKRMRPLTSSRPKALLPVGGEPLLFRLLRQLAGVGVRDATLVVGYQAASVRDAVGDGARFGLKIDYATQNPPRGTGHALMCADLDERAPALVLNGDLFLGDDVIASVVAAGPGALAAHAVPDARAYGVFETESGRAVRVVEKSPDPPTNLANAGVYHAPPGFAQHLRDLQPSPRGEFELTDALNASFAQAPWKVVEIPEWLDVGRPWDLLAATERAMRGMPHEILGKVEAGATLHGPVHVGEGAIVKAGAYIEGPVHIGPRCVIGPNCYLRPFTALSEGVKIGNACEVKASVVMEGAHVGHLSYVGDSVIGAHANLGAGTLVANLRHDGKSVHVVTQGERVDTGRRKMGVVLGDDVHTGINTSLNTGVVLPAGAATLPGEVVMKSRF